MELGQAVIDVRGGLCCSLCETCWVSGRCGQCWANGSWVGGAGRVISTRRCGACRGGAVCMHKPVAWVAEHVLPCTLLHTKPPFSHPYTLHPHGRPQAYGCPSCRCRGGRARGTRCFASRTSRQTRCLKRSRRHWGAGQQRPRRQSRAAPRGTAWWACVSLGVEG